LVALLQGYSDRPLIDNTGLAGMFEILMEVPQQKDRAGWFDAMRERVDRLGLKPESQKGRVGVLVVDHVERPSGN